MSCVLGIDLSTQSLKALIYDYESCEKVGETSIKFAEICRAEDNFDSNQLIVKSSIDGKAEQPVVLYLRALDFLLSEIDIDLLQKVKAVNFSAQQHGHIYLNQSGYEKIISLNRSNDIFQTDEDFSLEKYFSGGFSFENAPIWKSSDSYTAASQIRESAGGSSTVLKITGSDIPARFTAAVVCKKALEDSNAYLETRIILQINTFLAALFSGNPEAGVDTGNNCGTGWMDFSDKSYSDCMVSSTFEDLPGGVVFGKQLLPHIVSPLSAVGKVNNFFIKKYKLNSECLVMPGTGDNPASKVTSRSGLLSLGTSFVLMKNLDSEAALNPLANRMYDGLGEPFEFYCRTNGANVWDRAMKAAGIADYKEVDKVLKAFMTDETISIWQPDAETVPLTDSIVPFSDQEITISDKKFYSGVVNSSLILLEHFSGSISTVDKLQVTGGASKSAPLIRRIAAIWGVPVEVVEDAGAGGGAAAAAIIYLDTVNKSKRESESVCTKIAGTSSSIIPDPELVVFFNLYKTKLLDYFKNLH